MATTSTALQRTGLGTLVALQYPNGRSVERLIPGEMRCGDKFELYGHCWRAVRPILDRRRRSIDNPSRLLCQPAD
jgi:hypothetical protein